MNLTTRTGILLINTGSPDAPHVPETRRYLRQFLSDPRVIDIAPAARWALLNFVILPFRPKQSSEAYEAIWTERGSPLIVNSEDFRDALRLEFPEATIEIAMAYGNPSIPDMIDRLVNAGVDSIVVVPMFPQYASATTGSVLECVYKTAAEKPNVPPLVAVAPYYNDAGYLDAWAEVARPQLDSYKPDHILMSFHGLPERQIYKCDPTGNHCLKKPDCCERYLEGNPNCYRAHCAATSRGIAERLGLKEADFTLCFQSKLGRDPWLSPATDRSIVELARKGIKRLAILSPAFVADCLETLEELGIRGKKDFIENGGEDVLLVSSLNSHPRWVAAMADILRRI
jgi:ferrochelatase